MTVEPLRLVLMGTGEFARPAFAALGDGPHAVVGLVTGPDRGGPGHHDHPHPLRDDFNARGVTVLQPENVNEPGSLEKLAAMAPDLLVVAAYGQILKPPLITLPRLGAINLHASLLPRHRGATPIHHAILAGDHQTGVSIFRIEPAVDTGPLLASVATPIGSAETCGELHDRLSLLAVDLTANVVDQLAEGTAQTLAQDDRQATRAPRLKKADGAIDWTLDAQSLDRHVRAMQPWPNPFTFLHHGTDAPRRLIVLAVEPGTGEGLGEVRAGELVIEAEGGGLLVGCGAGAIARITRLQPEGRRGMSAVEFLRGTLLETGDRLGPLDD